ncbi:DUF6440 family protein [Wukongibacter baidiensis]|uniref:DUF6440 family protein n=1 Tax=Wukongibacter baidiensis TaxID=1723361 RepID=UPI003D7F4705
MPLAVYLLPIIPLLVAAIVVGLIFYRLNKAGESGRFRVVYKQNSLPHYRIVVDTKTGVNYLLSYNSGLTVLLDQYGKPVITPIRDNF